MNAIIIRFEGSSAICRKETNSLINIKRTLIPSAAKEGDVLEIIGDKVSINAIETRKKREKVQSLMEDILS